MMTYKLLYPLVGFCLFAIPLRAQHEHPTQTDSTQKRTKPSAIDHAKQGMQPAEDWRMDGSAESREHMQRMGALGEVPMSHAFSMNLPMNRDGSGTGWLPDATPVYSYRVQGRKWIYMFHGNVFVRYNNQDLTNKGSRGDTKVDVLNWFMATGQRKVGNRGLFRFSALFSLDQPFGGDGGPLLFQTGNTFQGQPLIDRQHPNNLFSELSLGYAHMLNEDMEAFVYLGYPGEPALGPGAFLHRPSSQNNLDSPLGHHWQDATHITFGVVTLGLRYKIFKLEGSLFSGHEPSEARYGFDEPHLDSYSYRVLINPHPHWALQASRGHLKSPETSEPGVDVLRTTASVLHALPWRTGNYNLNSALIWGYNDTEGDQKGHSITLESNWQMDRLAVYGRYEYVEKSARALQVDKLFDHDRLFAVNALTLGTNYIVLRAFNTNLAVGVQGSIFLNEKALNPVYGNNPLAGQVYIRVYPHLMRMRINGMVSRNGM